GLGGDDTLDGGDGDDTLAGGDGNDTIGGGNGNDVLDGQAGVDIARGGTGDDKYHVENSNDQAIEYANEGHDTVHSTVSFTLSQYVEDLRLWEDQAISGTGNELNNYISGNSAANLLTGLGGNDTLDGGEGDDILDGGNGSDKLTGGKGNDTYRFGRGGASDLIFEDDATPGNRDTVQFWADITAEQLWFAREGDNLTIRIIGTDDNITITNHYRGNQYQIEQFKTANGKILYVDKVHALVDAMAGLSLPAVGETNLSNHYLATLNPVIAASWI
ncbi:MAG: hemolysin-type calcium-binding protein, partial [Ottowia sp.]|nr:hemolysin-type calcium-binding protein [Ottowia sp.]